MSRRRNPTSFIQSPLGQKLILVGVAGLLGYVLWRKLKAEAVKGLDPTNPQNIANRSVEAAGAAVTGNPNWTVTGALLDTFPFLKSSAEKQFEASMKPVEKVVNP